jgi:hypothetical protein
MVMNTINEELVNQFKIEVVDRAGEIDGSDSQDWFSLTLGWAIAKGVEPADAHDFAIHIRYDSGLMDLASDNIENFQD